MYAHHEPSPAVYGCPSVAEIAEFARRAAQMDFGPAHRRVMMLALLRSSGVAIAPATGPFTACDSHVRTHG